MSDDTTCKHCHERIVEVNFLLGKSWMHQKAGAAFHDGMYKFCRLKVATPKEAKKK